MALAQRKGILACAFTLVRSSCKKMFSTAVIVICVLSCQRVLHQYVHASGDWCVLHDNKLSAKGSSEVMQAHCAMQARKASYLRQSLKGNPEPGHDSQLGCHI